MTNLEEIKRTINTYKPLFREEFQVRTMSLFGSYVRNEQHPESDIDILVEFDNTMDLFEFIRLENVLSELLGRKVDLVMKDALKPRIKDRILMEAVEI